MKIQARSYSKRNYMELKKGGKKAISHSDFEATSNKMQNIYNLST